MLRDRRLVKPLVALLAVSVVVLGVSGCAFPKQNSLALSQPQGIGSVRVHFNLCTLGAGTACGPNEENESVQFLAGIAVPPGSVPPATLTATPVGGGSPIVFTRNEEVAREITASSAVINAALQKAAGEAETPMEKEILELIKGAFGSGSWPPSGLQGVGYLSAPVQEAEGANGEWSVDADFGLPTPAAGSPFAGPFGTAIAYGFRVVSPSQPASRPIHCTTIEPPPQESDAFCSGSLQQAQLGTADLKIAGPAKPGQAFVGGSGKVAFSLKYAGTPPAVPSFALSATTTAKGGKAKPASTTFTPAGPTGTGKVTVSVPKSTKPGTYQVTLTAATPQGGTAVGVGKLKVTKPTLKFNGVKLDTGKGTATLKVKVPSGGSLTVTGKGIAKVKKKAKKAMTLKVKITPTGSTSGELEKAGSLKV
ncbi:MAG TPA: hypothetical protein VGF09_00720, partial [Solirubrobacterales bacterium]